MAPPPKKHAIHTWRERVIAAAMGQYDGPPMAGPLKMEVTFTMPRPGRFKAKRHPDGKIRHDRRPDIDNLVKAVMDGLRNHVWSDDAQVFSLVARKHYAGRDDATGATIYIEEGGAC
jgi:Holliday junction resolvase RusA-like endonuclease